MSTQLDLEPVGRTGEQSEVNFWKVSYRAPSLSLRDSVALFLQSES